MDAPVVLANFTPELLGKVRTLFSTPMAAQWSTDNHTRHSRSRRPLTEIATRGSLKVSLSNAALADLLAQEAKRQKGIRRRAFKKAARSAFLWPQLAGDLVREGCSLTELKGIGPFIAKQLRAWLERPPGKVAQQMVL
jgi:hypothetical protein